MKDLSKQKDLIVQEDIEQDKVTWKDYLNFANFSYGLTGMISYIFLALLTGFIQLFTTYYLSIWTGMPTE